LNPKNLIKHINLPKKLSEKTLMKHKRYLERLYVQYSNGLNTGLLFNKDPISIGSVMNEFEEKVEHFNSIYTHNPGNALTMPIMDVNRFKKKQNDDVKDIDIMNGLPYGPGDKLLLAIKDSVLLGKNVAKFVVKEEHKEKIRNLNKKLNDYRNHHPEFNNKYTNSKSFRKSLNDHARNGNNNEYKEYTDIIKELMDLNKKIKKPTEKVYHKNMYSVPKKMCEESFVSEMTHYRDVNKTKSQTDIKYYEDVDTDDMVEEIIKWMYDTCLHQNEHHSKVFENGNDTEEMNQLKDLMMKDYKEYANQLSKLNIYQLASFINQFFKSLLYLSQSKIKHNEFYLERFESNNVLMIVKGGKNLHQTGMSRLFRFYMPVPNFVKNLKIYSSDYKYTEKECTYVLSPWMQYNEKVLTEKISFFEKFLSSSLISMFRNGGSIKGTAFIHLLSLNNRRSTESLLGDIRYLLVNSLACKTDIETLIKSFVIPPRDLIQRHIINSIKKRYADFYESFPKSISSNYEIKTRHPFINVMIESDDDTATLLYCTYMMTKAPYNQALEQAKNLEGMMTIHKSWTKLFDGTVETDAKKILDMVRKTESEDIFGNPHYFSPVECYQVGQFASDYFKGLGVLPDLHSKWNNLLSKDWHEPNESGLRADFVREGEGFFGRKSAEVYMEKLLDEIKPLGSIDKVLHNIDDMIKNTYAKVKEMKSYDLSYVKKINEIGKIEIRFHAVEKEQWKGRREIYVMTISTKTIQQPLEKMFGFMCKFVENEIISVSSSKRLPLMHARLFETGNKDSTVFFFSLDCKKWGPQAMFLKYTYFVRGLESILPKSFTDLFYAFSNLYLKKKVTISPKTWNAFKNNVSNKDDLKYFKVHKRNNGKVDIEVAEFEMPYSFVMGIFNYLSSLMHAFNQMKSVERITKEVKEIFKVDISFHMDAHSDDSAGKLVIHTKNPQMVQKILCYVLINYEIDLKLCNHMLSIKKCNISEIYSEMLSILYLNNRLTPLIPKFYANINMKPTMEGYAADMATCVGKCIEIVTYGATFSEAYIFTRLNSLMVSNFYNFKERKDAPYNCFGGLYAHPIMYMLLGSAADQLRLYKSNPDDFNAWNNIMSVLSMDEREILNQKGVKPRNYTRMKNSLKVLKDRIKDLYGDWVDHEFVKQGKLKGTLMQPLNFYQALGDKNFTNSLMYHSNTRRISRIFFSAKHELYETPAGHKTLKEVKELTDYIFSSYKDPNLLSQINPVFKTLLEGKLKVEHKNIYDFMLGEADVIYEYLRGNILEGVHVVKENMSFKPAEINVNLSPHSIETEYNLLEIYHADHSQRWMLSSRFDLIEEKHRIEQKLRLLNLEYEDFSQFEFYLRKLKKYGEKQMNIYAKVHSTNRYITGYDGIVSMLETNTLPNHTLKKLYRNIMHRNLEMKNISNLPLTTLEELAILKITAMSRKSNSLKSLKYGEEFIKDYRNFKNPQLMDNFLYMLGDVKNVKYYYYWDKMQSKRGARWSGKGTIIFVMDTDIFHFEVMNEFIMNCTCNKLNVDEHNLNICIYILDKMNLKFDITRTDHSYDLIIGYHKPKYEIGFSKDFDINACNLEVDPSISFVKGDATMDSEGNVYKVGKKVNLLYENDKIDIKFFRKNFTFTEKSNSFLRLLVGENRYNNEYDIIHYLTNLNKTKFYKHFIHNKIPQEENEKYASFRTLLRNACDFEKLKMNDLIVDNIMEILETNIDPMDLPDDVYEKLLEIQRDQMWQGFHKDILDHLDLTLRSEEPDWAAFLRKYVVNETSAFQLVQATMKNRIFYKQPYAFTMYFGTESVILAHEVSKFLSKNFKTLMSIRKNKNTRSFVEAYNDKSALEFFYLLNVTSPDGGHNPLHEIVKELIHTLFDNFYLYNEFKKYAEGTRMLRILDLDSSFVENFAQLYLVCLTKLPEYDGNHIDEVANYEKESRMIDGHDSFKTDYNHFPGKEAMNVFGTKNSFKLGKMNYHLDKTVKNTGRYRFPQIQLAYPTKLNTEHDEYDYFGDVLYNYDRLSRTEALEVMTEMGEQFAGYTIKAKPKVKKTKDGEMYIKVPFIRYLGKMSLTKVMSVLDCFILITFILPDDYHNINPEYTKVYKVPYVSGETLINDACYMIVYNIKGEFNNFTSFVEKNLRDYRSLYLDENSKEVFLDITQDLQEVIEITDVISTYQAQIDESNKKKIKEDGNSEEDDIVTKSDAEIALKDMVLKNKDFKKEELLDIKKYLSILEIEMNFDIMKSHPANIKLFIRKKLNMKRENLNIDTLFDIIAKESEASLNFSTEGFFTKTLGEELMNRVKKPQGDYTRFTPIPKDSELFLEMYGILGDLTYDLMNGRCSMSRDDKIQISDKLTGMQSRIENFKTNDSKTKYNLINLIEFLNGMLEDISEEKENEFNNHFKNWKTTVNNIDESMVTLFGEGIKSLKHLKKKVYYAPIEEFDYEDLN
jgi:hypothetical protein